MDLTLTATIHSKHEQVSYTTKSTSIVMILSLITKIQAKQYLLNYFREVCVRKYTLKKPRRDLINN